MIQQALENQTTQEVTQYATEDVEEMTEEGCTGEGIDDPKGKRAAAFTEQQEMKLIDFLMDNEQADPKKQEALWATFRVENKMNNAACKCWFKSQTVIYSLMCNTNH